MCRYKFNLLAINSTTAVATEAMVSPALPATAVVEIYGQVAEFVSVHGMCNQNILIDKGKQALYN